MSELDEALAELARVRASLAASKRIAAEAILLMTPQQRSQLREKMDSLKEAV
jgi:multidrug resistance efflux pump